MVAPLTQKYLAIINAFWNIFQTQQHILPCNCTFISFLSSLCYFKKVVTFILHYTLVASWPFLTWFLVNSCITLGSKSVMSISIVWSGSTSARPDRYLSKGFNVYKYQQSLKWFFFDKFWWMCLKIVRFFRWIMY